MYRLPGWATAVQGPSQGDLAVALLVSSDEQQLPEERMNSSNPLSAGARWLSQVGEEATHHQHKLQTLGRLGPLAGSRLRSLIRRAEGLPQNSGLRILFLIFF